MLKEQIDPDELVFIINQSYAENQVRVVLPQLLIHVGRILKPQGIQIKALLQVPGNMLLQEMPGVIQVLEDLNE